MNASRWVSWVPWVAAGVLWLAAPQGPLGKEHDDALYVLAGQSLAGGSYRAWYLPGHPPITQTTPGLPALLWPVAAAAPDALWAYQLLMGLFLALCAPLLWKYFRRRWPAPVALALTLLFALNPLVLSRSGAVMPEAPFLLATLGVLLLFERSGPLLGAGLLAAYLIRPAAIPLWAAVGIALAARRRWKDLAWAAGIPLAGLALWALWCQGRGGVQETSELALLYRSADAATVAAILKTNAANAARVWGQTILPTSLAQTGAAWGAGAVLSALALIGLGKRFFQRRWDPGLLFLSASLGMHLLWPWWYDRYLLPLLPFLWAAVVAALPERWGSRFPKKVALVLGGIALLAFFAQGIRFFQKGERANRPACSATYDWILAHTALSDRFASPFYARDILQAGRLFQPLPGGDTAADFVAALRARRIAYVLWENNPDFGFSRSDNAVARRLRKNGEALADRRFFQPVFDDPAGNATLYILSD
jgi:hypothetical protein